MSNLFELSRFYIFIFKTIDDCYSAPFKTSIFEVTFEVKVFEWRCIGLLVQFRLSVANLARPCREVTTDYHGSGLIPSTTDLS